MKQFVIIISLLVALSVQGADWYVATTGDNSDGSTWSKAYTNIQTAIDAAANDDTIYLAGQTFTPPLNTSTGRLMLIGKGLSFLGGYAMDGTPGTTTSNTMIIGSGIKSANTNRLVYISDSTNSTFDRIQFKAGAIGWSSAQIDGKTYSGAGVFVHRSTNIVFSGCTVADNSLGSQQNGYAWGAGLFSSNSFGTISNCLIMNNILERYITLAEPRYGCGLSFINSGFLVVDSIIRDNLMPKADYSDVTKGIGIYASNSVMTIKNCAITRNFGESTSRPFGDALYVEGGTTLVQNCTIYGHQWEAVRRASGTLTILDSILWNNGLTNILGTVTVSNNCIQDGLSDGVDGNIKTDPLLDRGLYLSASSPCVDTGSQTAEDAGLASKTTRANGTLDTGIVDMGYHFPNGTTDYYVSVTSGSDANNGTSSVTSFKTIAKAARSAIDGTHINIEAGTYTTNTQVYPISISNKWGVQLLGTNMDLTILNHNGASNRCIVMGWNYPDARIEKFSVINGYLKGGAVELHKYGGFQGLAFYINQSEGLMNQCIASNNLLVLDPNGGWGWPGGLGLSTFDSALVVSNCVFTCNTNMRNYWADSAIAGGVYLYHPLAPMVNCKITKNFTVPGNGSVSYQTRCYGGGLSIYDDSYFPITNILIRNCLISDNIASNGYLSSIGSAVCILINNRSPYKTGANGIVLENCTMVENTISPTRNNYAYQFHSVTAGGSPTSSLFNCNFWSNDSLDVTGTVNMIYCNTQQGINNGTNGCVSVDPKFENPYRSNYKLAWGSPLRNAGTNLSWMTGGFDLDGNPRIVSGTNDIGCYEIQSTNLLQTFYFVKNASLILQKADRIILKSNVLYTNPVTIIGNKIVTGTGKDGRGIDFAGTYVYYGEQNGYHRWMKVLAGSLPNPDYYHDIYWANSPWWNVSSCFQPGGQGNQGTIYRDDLTLDGNPSGSFPNAINGATGTLTVGD